MSISQSSRYFTAAGCHLVEVEVEHLVTAFLDEFRGSAGGRSGVSKRWSARRVS
ncbi:MAG: hypothetical protein R2705_14340 [Ilumatobacteraceae bacterium]